MFPHESAKDVFDLSLGIPNCDSEYSACIVEFQRSGRRPWIGKEGLEQSCKTCRVENASELAG